jgi:hypothetical protein
VSKIDQDFRSFPDLVQDVMGFALYQAQIGRMHGSAIYVLHAFQKKSKHGIKTPQAEIDLMKRRLKAAEEDHKKQSEATNE